MAIGTTWEYGRKGIEPPMLTRRIVGKELSGGKELLKVETLAGDEVTLTELISVAAEGVLLHQRTPRDGQPSVLNHRTFWFRQSLRRARSGNSMRISQAARRGSNSPSWAKRT
jgi:hypothetical protein